MDKMYLTKNIDFKTIKKDPVIVDKYNVDENAKICFIGDLHSSLHSLWRMLNKIRNDFFINDTFTLKDNHHIIFLGDIVDRGPYGIELLWIIFTLFIKNPDKIRIINGNHEDKETYERYGFVKEISSQFGQDVDKTKSEYHYALWRLPSVIFLKIGADTKYFQLCHGGPVVIYEEDGENKNLTVYTDKINVDGNKLIEFLKNDKEKFYIYKDHAPLNLFKWADASFADNSQKTSQHDISTGRDAFNQNYVKKYLDDLNLHTIISGHQDNVNFATLPFKTELKNKCNNYNLNCTSSEFDKNVEFELPSNDILMLVTSSAVGTKYNNELNTDTYLILEKE
jgi:hypothetical protein